LELDAGVVLLHVVAAGSERFLQRGEGHAAPLLGRGHRFDDQLADAGTCFLGFRGGLLLGRFGRGGSRAAAAGAGAVSAISLSDRMIYRVSHSLLSAMNDQRSRGAAPLNNT